MKPAMHPAIRRLLRANSDGLTVAEIASALDIVGEGLRLTLSRMPDAYIDRWIPAKQRRPCTAVWCVVVPPEDCPKPDTLAKRRLT